MFVDLVTKTDEFMKCYFEAILDQIIVQAPIIPHFKGLAIRNLEFEIRICQKNSYQSHNYNVNIVQIF